MPIAYTKDNLKLNDYLTERRLFLKIRFGDLVARTGIPAKHLKKIEKGEWCDLPSGVYVKGFLKKYAQVVGLDENELALRYENEWQQICYVDLPKPKNKILNRLNFLKQVSFRWLVLGTVGVFVLFYIGWQFKVILEKPDLNLNYPTESDTIVDNPKLEFKGKVSRDSVLTINNETIFAGEDGSFVKEIELLNGINTFEIKAVSRFGKENKEIKRVTYNP
ncbi:MAG: helix-turn-helix domain-containing protein [bacterium]|nr:helix-turn-helix domain-containing protein [bacterium]